MKTLIIAKYIDGTQKEFTSKFSKESIAETLDYAEEHFWTYVCLDYGGQVIPMSGIQEVTLYELQQSSHTH